MERAGTILVTGAAGFAGGHLLDLLLNRGAAIVGWFRPGTKQPLDRGRLRWMPVELLDREQVFHAVAEVQPAAVYHLAGAAHVAQSWRYTLETYQGNVLATHHLLTALCRLPARPRVLVTCSAAVYRAQDYPLTENDPVAPGSPYATSKLAQEMLALHAWNDDALPTLVARSFNHTGPGQEPSYVASSVARQIARIEKRLQEPTLTMGNLEPKRDVSDVRDIVRAYVAMMERATPGRPYNVCSGRDLSVRRLVDTFTTRAHVPVEIVQDPTLLRPNDTPLLVGSHARLTAETGWAPQIPIEQTVDDLLEYWRARVRDDA